MESTPISRGVIRLRGIDIQTETREIEHSKLKFYTDNPRIYSLVRAGGADPTQEEIYKELLELEHVKVLIDDIRNNGGLMDPLVVRDGDMVVLEGNSRLAAIKFLTKADVVKWARVRCTVLPANIDEALVFALLGQYHVKGKKDWAPFEKAGFLYRRFKEHNIELSVVARELGIGVNEAKRLVEVYEFMQTKDEPKDRWSFYDEYLKSRKIAKVREDVASFDDFVVEQVRSKAIPSAMMLRDRLPVICAAKNKTLKRYVDGLLDFEEAYERAVEAGGESYELKKLKTFRQWLAKTETEDDVLSASKAVRDAIKYELNNIEKRAKKLADLVEAKDQKHKH
jgi:hypothetical protein